MKDKIEEAIDKLVESSLVTNIAREQYRLIAKKWGKEAADDSEYGWNTDEEGVFETRVWGDAGGHLTIKTYFDPDGPANQKLTHEWPVEQA
jgi:hypothetical protein